MLSFTRSVFDRLNNRVSTATPTLTLSGGGNRIITGATPGITPNTQFKTPVELNAINPARLIIGGSSNLWESTNQGNNVTNISSAIGINQTSPVAYGGKQSGIDNEAVLYVGSGSSVYVRTSGSGAPTITADLPGTDEIQDIVLDPTDWAKAFVVDTNSVFSTSNSGGAWTDITGNLMSLAGAALTSIQYIPGPIGALVVGGNLGVFTALLSSLGTWTEVGSNLPNALVYDMDYDATDDVLVIGTLGRGAWSLPNASDVLGGAPPATEDFGDAPDAAQSGFVSSYPVTLAENGASHTATGPRLGANRDSEADGTHSVLATADDTTGAPDDEDGVRALPVP